MEITLAAPNLGRPDLLIIAGEQSGDEHAARLIQTLRQASPELRIVAVGGAQMKAAGAQLLFDLLPHAVVGIVEVLQGYRFFRQLLQALLAWIQRYKPRHICFVDYPGFNLRLAHALKKAQLSRQGGGTIGLHYYIGPQVWAWKAQRRFAMARSLDDLAVIFPFEVDCYRDTGLAVQFVGHPLVAPGSDLRMAYNAEGPLLLLPGSRRGPIARILPTMLAVFDRLQQDHPKLIAQIIYPTPELKVLIEDLIGRRNIELVASNNPVTARAVLASAGTMSLKCALAGIPGAIVYRAHPITYLLGRMLVRIPYLAMANILLQRSVYPEFIQRAAKPHVLAKTLAACLDDDDHYQQMRLARDELRDLFSVDVERTAQQWLLQQLRH